MPGPPGRESIALLVSRLVTARTSRLTPAVRRGGARVETAQQSGRRRRRAERPPAAGSAVGVEGKRNCPVKSGSGVPDSPATRGIARPLLLLPLPLDIELPLLAPGVHRA